MVKLRSKVYIISEKICREVLGLRPGEKVLIISNEGRDQLTIAHSLYRACAVLGGVPVLMVQPVKDMLDFAEDSVIYALRSKPDVIVSISKKKLGKDRFAMAEPLRTPDGRLFDHIFDYLYGGLKCSRAFWSPGITLETYERAANVDYDYIRRVASWLYAKLTSASKLTITTPRGGLFKAEIKGRRVFKDDGDIRRRGSFGNIPCGEVFTSPVTGLCEGVLVFDGSISINGRTILLSSPITVEVESGYVREVRGGPEADLLRKAIMKARDKARKLMRSRCIDRSLALKYATNARAIGEIGFGINPKAKVVGVLIEDEKAWGTVHVAIGSNYEGDAPALNHFDCVMTKPTVEVDGEVIVENGRLKVEM